MESELGVWVMAMLCGRGLVAALSVVAVVEADEACKACEWLVLRSLVLVSTRWCLEDDDGDATAEYFDFIPWRNIPIGPPGTKRRWLARSNSVTSFPAGT